MATATDLQSPEEKISLAEEEQKELQLLLSLLPLRHLSIKQRIRTLLMSNEGFLDHTLAILFSAPSLTIRQWKQEWRDGGIIHLHRVMESAGIMVAQLLQPQLPCPLASATNSDSSAHCAATAAKPRHLVLLAWSDCDIEELYTNQEEGERGN